MRLHKVAIETEGERGTGETSSQLGSLVRGTGRSVSSVDGLRAVSTVGREAVRIERCSCDPGLEGVADSAKRKVGSASKT